MKASGFSKADWIIGLALALVLALLSGSGLLPGLERKAHDFGMRLASAQPSAQVAVIAIDDASIASIGRWPWPHDVHARLIDILTQAKPRAIGHTVLFTEPQFDPGNNPAHASIVRLRAMLEHSALKAISGPAAIEVEEIETLLAGAEAAMDTDRRLAASLKASGNVLLGMMFQALDRERPAGSDEPPLPDYMRGSLLPLAAPDPAGGAAALPALGPIVPIAALGAVAAGVGHLNPAPDIDGAVRADALLVRHRDHHVPSMALLLAARSLGVAPGDIQVDPGQGVRLGPLAIRTDPRMRMQTFFYPASGGRPAFAPDSFHDVLSGRVPAGKYRDRIVIIGATAAGVGSSPVAAVAADLPPVLALAHAVSSILQEDAVATPWWDGWVRWGALLLVLLYLVLALPRIGVGLAAAVSAVLFAAMLAAQLGLMSGLHLRVPLTLPLALLLLGHLALTARRVLAAAGAQTRSDADPAGSAADPAHSNRMLGLGYQGQGQLDQAFACFRRLPQDESVLELLYNLGLDYERQRQHGKAAAVFRYIAGLNPAFRDAGARGRRAAEPVQPPIEGSGALPPGGAPVPAPAPAAETPRLGRYEVEKELGKGAMGVVYQGRDPKIGRVVAIKTLALAQEFEGDELADVKARFFREAQTAGRLAHPNIVTIYDTGEEQDLAYIAMEFLKGGDLVAHARPDALLPLRTVLAICARVADALGYAHQNNVVHRDVKPANIMYEPRTDTVKVTDFGIARITDSSRTKTGLVLGTPSYMSPEQLSGQKIDGKSDLFSLGVTLYQLSCGHLPFTGDSMAQLMFRIANEPPADIRTIRADVPACLAAILDRALAKQPAQRYQTGEAMAAAIRECAGRLG